MWRQLSSDKNRLRQGPPSQAKGVESVEKMGLSAGEIGRLGQRLESVWIQCRMPRPAKRNKTLRGQAEATAKEYKTEIEGERRFGDG